MTYNRLIIGFLLYKYLTKKLILCYYLTLYVSCFKLLSLVTLGSRRERLLYWNRFSET